jgi:hypothetical protein
MKEKVFRKVDLSDCVAMAPLKCTDCGEIIILPVSEIDMPPCESCGNRNYIEVARFMVRVARVQRRWAEFEVFGEVDGRGAAHEAFAKALAADDGSFSPPSSGSFEVEGQERLESRVFFLGEIQGVGATLWFNEHGEYPVKASDSLTGKEISLFKRVYIDGSGRFITGDFWSCRCKRGSAWPLSLDMCSVCGCTRKEGEFPTLEETLAEMVSGFLRPIKAR